MRRLLTGRDDRHLISWGAAGVRVHRDMVASFERLRARASGAGFDLHIISGFRSFSDQLRIWNMKATGQRAVLDTASKPLDISSLPSIDLVHAILRWSALPGASRHHWGTDIDVIDAKAVPPGYKVQLIPQEVGAGGMFGPLHDWLDKHLHGEGFYRPYDQDRGGVSPERWHLSYFPLASNYTQALTEEMVLEAWQGSDVQLQEAVEKNIDEIFRKFVKNIASPPKECSIT